MRGRRVTHGGYASTDDPTVRVLQSRWSAMLKRCEPARKRYASRYADRGIAVCKSWLKFVNFKLWALANGFEPTLTLDRENNNLGYTPSNCRWATQRQQAVNRVSTIKVRNVDTGCVFESTAAASEALGLNKLAVSIALRRNTRCGGFRWEALS